MKTSSALVLFVVYCCAGFSRSQPTTPLLATTAANITTTETSEVNDNSQLVGGLTSQDVDDKLYYDLATVGVGKLDALRGEKCERKISKIVDAQSQVVAGTRYLLKVEVCSPAMCEGKQDIPVCDICLLDLWEKRWINFLQGVGDRKTKNQVDTVFRKLDLNQDGVITLEEFIESCLKDELIIKSIQVFDWRL